MAQISLNVYSSALGMQTNVQVIIPQKITTGEIGVTNGERREKYPCLYLLHGLSDDQSIWLRRTSIERYAAKYGICVVMPSGGKSFYTDEKYGLKYYTYIAKELPNIIEEIFHVSTDRKDRFIGGNSMGGYGALKIAMQETGRYSAAFGLSSVANIRNETFTRELIPVFGGQIPTEATLYDVADTHEQDEEKPRLYMTIGKDDYMYEDNIDFQKYMRKKAYDYTFVETEGDHNWDLWDKTVQVALEWALQ